MALIKKSAPTATDTPFPAADSATLIAQLADPQADVRRRAALDLATLPPQAEAIRALSDQVARETDEPTRESLLTALLTYGGADVVAALIPLLRSEEAPLRNAVIEVLQQLDEPVVPFIDAMLADADVDYRIFSINVISHLNHPHAPQWLHRVICHDPDINVCGAAVEGLAEVGTPDMVADLNALPARFDDDPFMTFSVQMAVARIRSDG